MRRNALPSILPGATEFSAAPDLRDELWAVRLLRRNPQWLDPLLEATSLNRNWGRPRIEGRWALAYLAFAASPYTDIEPWWATSQPPTWAECEFIERPSYPTVYSRFTELEEHADAFQSVVSHLVQHARAHSGGHVGRDIHVDGTEAETNARLVHDCRPDEPCSRRTRRARTPTYPQRATVSEVRHKRHLRTAQPPEEDPESLDIGDADELVQAEDGPVRLKVRGCWYRSLDRTAGIRAYVRNERVSKFWHGYYSHKAIDHYTGAPVAILVSSASQQEYHAYPQLMQNVTETIGATPRAVVGDKGYSVDSVFEFNTRAGIASVFPYRPRHHTHLREDSDGPRYDRHGIPRCQHCGGPTRYHRFAASPSPRLWFKCEAPLTDGCQGVQSITCSHDWRSLLPLWRTEEAYFALKESHSQYERVHGHFRSKYRVGGANHATRPKRLGQGWQQLRSNAALVIEWLRILHLEGWLGTARRNTHRPRLQRGRGVRSLLNFRSRVGLHLPYGPAAEALGLVAGRGSPPGTDPPGSRPDDELPF